MRVLFLAAEFAPLAKVGGLADVAGELPHALKRLGVDVRVYIPFHQLIDRSSLSINKTAEFELPQQAEDQAGMIYHSTIDGLSLYLVDGDPISQSDGIYSDPESDGDKFTFFSLGALKALGTEGWQADIVHAHDWHASPAVVWMDTLRKDDDFWKDTATILTVHNLPYMGAGTGSALSAYGLEIDPDPRLPERVQGLPLAMGLARADWISTVSPSYAEEIQTPSFGHGLETLIRERRDHLVGILNGIDLDRWNPATDDALSTNFDRSNLRSRPTLRRSVLENLNLSIDPEIPLLTMITRLDYQKGADLTFEALESLVDQPWQLVVLGTGDPILEERARAFERTHPDRARSIIRFDTRLARKIYAGGDMILIPSRYEPCGLTQMIAMRYGCVPVVAATGGLKDTVVDYGSDPKGTGFVFDHGDDDGLVDAIRRAITTYQDKRRWRGLQRRGMRKDFSWTASARRYLQLYEAARRERLEG